MNILGVIGFGKNPAAGLVVDGEIVAFAEEERFTRLKGSHGFFPSKAIAFCLAKAKLNLAEVDRIAFAWDATKYPWKILRHLGVKYLRYHSLTRNAYHKKPESSSFLIAFRSIIEYMPGNLRQAIAFGLRAAGLGGDLPPIDFVPHHLAHAASAYYLSGYDQAGILTLDGSGEEICTQLGIGEGDNIRITETFPIPHSLGWFYAAITQYLGFIPYRDEGKVMGLAALGEPRKALNPWIEPLSRILRVGQDAYEVDPSYTLLGGHYYGEHFTDKLVKLIAGIVPGTLPVNYGEKVAVKGRPQSKYLLDHYVDLAWAAQELLERAALTLARKLVRDYGQENLCIAGGVGLNCKMNGEILRNSGCRNLFVMPAASDSGSALGAALYVARQRRCLKRVRLSHTFYGPSYSNEAIYDFLQKAKLNFEETDDPAVAAAQLLAEGKIIGWFQGGMEFGPRALGGRSILANPLFPEIKDKVNAEVKFRESWRPFCPSLLEEHRERYFTQAAQAPFMIVAYPATDLAQKELASVVHVDGTVRPQTVTREANPRFHQILLTLGKTNGHPVVLNTSFNVRGEPIVCMPSEAVRCFFATGLDALVMENFILRKENP
jgi:carbamoyltransferase